MIIPILTPINSKHLDKNNTGLGNVLFEIFSAYGLSKKYKHTFNNYYLIELINKLDNLSLNNHSKTIFRNLKLYKPLEEINMNKQITLNEQQNYYSLYDKNIINLIKKYDDKYCIMLNGYLQSHLYFDEYYDEIKNLIKPDKDSINLIKNKYSHLFNQNNINISVHVRLEWGHNISYNAAYFYEAVSYIKNKINNNENKNIVINIFSDNINKAKQIFKFDEKDRIIFFENNLDYIDYWCMTLCNHNILSHSTLSWWGAYMNLNLDKIIIYPEDILKLRGSTIHPNLQLIERKTQHYKINWIPLKTKNVIYYKKKLPWRVRQRLMKLNNEKKK